MLTVVASEFDRIRSYHSMLISMDIHTRLYSVLLSLHLDRVYDLS